jgi:hypothetical protein
VEFARLSALDAMTRLLVVSSHRPPVCPAWYAACGETPSFSARAYSADRSVSNIAGSSVETEQITPAAASFRSGWSVTLAHL